MNVSFHLKEYLGRRWQDEMVTFDLKKHQPEGAVRVRREDGLIMSAQINDGSLSFIVDLEPYGEHVFDVVKDDCHELEIKTDIVIAENESNMLEMCNSVVGLRLPAGQDCYEQPLAASQVLPPLLAVRLLDGTWIGRGWFESNRYVKSRRTTVLADGPVFAEVSVEYVFDPHGYYRFNVRLISGQNVALIHEEYDLGDNPDEIDDFRFSFYTDFQPRIARWAGHTASLLKRPDTTPFGDNYTQRTEAEYEIDYSRSGRNFRLFPWLCWWPDGGRYWGAARSGEKHDDFIGIFQRHAGMWRNPSSLCLWTDAKPDLYLALPINVRDRDWEIDGVDLKYKWYTGNLESACPKTQGIREWGILVSSWERAVPQSNRMADSELTRAMIKHGEWPLDKVRRLTLEWKDPERIEFPRLFVSPGQVEDVVERVRGNSLFFRDLPGKNMEESADLTELSCLLNGGKQKDWARLFDYEDNQPNYLGHPGGQAGLKQQLDSFVDEMFAGEGMNGFNLHFLHGAVRVNRIAQRYDVVMASPWLTEEQRRHLRANMAMAAYVMADTDWFPEGTGIHLGNVNMPNIARVSLGMAACVLAGHPQSRSWAKKAKEFATAHLAKSTAPGGAWTECPHYQLDAAMKFLIELGIVLRNSGFDNFLDDHNLAAAMRFAAECLTPSDPRFGYRTLPALGNTGAGEGSPVFGMMAEAVATLNPALAAEMAWAWHNSGEFTSNPSSKWIIDPARMGSVPQYESKAYDGFGAILRNHFGTDRETFMIIHAGYQDSHYENDQGSFHLFAKGVPLCLDFGSQYTPLVRRPYMHNRISIDHAEDERMETSAEITNFQKTEIADYMCCHDRICELGDIPEDPWAPMLVNVLPSMRTIPPHLWKREILFVKDADPLGPNYFVIRDSFHDQPTLPTDWNLWCLAKDMSVQHQSVTFKGQFDIDLDVFVVKPEPVEVIQGEWAHTYIKHKLRRHLGNYDPVYSAILSRYQAKTGCEDFEERQKLCRIRQPAGKGYFVVLYPRQREEPKPVFTALRGACGVQIRVGSITDTVFLDAGIDFVGERKQFTGSVGMIREHTDGHTTMALLAPGRIVCGSDMLETQTASCKVIE